LHASHPDELPCASRNHYRIGLGKAIDEEARKGQGQDWSLMVGYVQSCLEKLPGAIDEWQEQK
jgi:hypothetical protein